MTPEEIGKRFSFHRVDEATQDRIDAIRLVMLSAAEAIDRLAGPDSREKSLAITKLEEAAFWANAAASRG